MNNKVIYILVFHILFLVGCAIEPTAESLWLEAENLADKGQFKEANIILNQAIEKDPQFLGAYINLGANYAALGEYEKAISYYESVLQKDKNNQLALFNIGNNYKRLNKYREAVKYYSNILTNIHGNPMSEIIVTDSDGNIGGYKVRFFEVAYERGLALYELQSWDSAFIDFKYCINNNYMVPESRYMCGAVYEIYGMDVKACEEYTIAAKMGDRDAKAAKKEVCK
jgi:tetratricopeptide (TPR) repeat protein